MLALIAGKGALPGAVAAAHGGPVRVCALEHCPPDLPVDRTFRLETLGSLLRWMRRQGVTDVCLCGSVTRPPVSLARVDLRTWPLVPRVLRALRRGDDGALRIFIAIFEASGFRVVAAHEAAPALLPPVGAWGQIPEGAAELARLGDAVSERQAAEDLGQACVLRDGIVLQREGVEGTDAMLQALTDAEGGVLYKAPKPGQDRRADLPVIGPETVRRAAAAGLSGIVIEAQGVMVLEQPLVRALIEETGLFLWVRERGA